MNKITLAYFGTPQFAADFLEKIILDTELPVEIKLVVTQPDRPVGRNQVISKSPIKRTAELHGLPVFDMEFKTVRQELLRNDIGKLTSELISKLSELDLALVYAFGRIIPVQLLTLPKFGMWNVHQSLLPLYRNVSPISYPIGLGDTRTGSTLMNLNEKLDEGEIIIQKELDISPHDKRSDLETKLTSLAYEMFKKTISELVKTAKMPDVVAQDHTKATYTRKLLKSDGYIPFEVLKKAVNSVPLQPQEFPQILQEYYQKYPETKVNCSSSQLLYNHYRAMFPWPGIWTELKINDQIKRLKVLSMELNGDKIILTKVQLEGKNEVDFKTFQLTYKAF